MTQERIRADNRSLAINIVEAAIRLSSQSEPRILAAIILMALDQEGYKLVPKDST